MLSPLIVNFVDENNLILASKLLKKSKIYNKDYKYILKNHCKRGDLVFLDPPFNKNYVNLLLPKIISDFSKAGTLIYIEESNFNFSDYDNNLKLLKETSSGNSFGRLFEVMQ